MITLIKMLMPMLLHALGVFVEQHNPDQETRLIISDIEEASNALIEKLK